ncbi:MAG: hypothetical protein R3185_03570 [Candidatus Thermoplasmatota archaeon]|nr:hypothetical protein [Candidatus Thermoplasmatota archaeon]
MKAPGLQPVSGDTGIQDVGIVGGGAAGLITGLTLLEQDPTIAITIYEREPQAYTTLCGEGISQKTLDLFSAFDSKPHCPQSFPGASWWFPGDATVLINEPCYTLERATWIPAMAQAFQDRGGSYLTNRKIKPDDVPLLAKEHDLLVGADGPGSQVRKHIGGQAVTRLGLQVRLQAPWEGDRLAFYTHKTFSPEYAWVFPKDDILNVGILGEADGKDWERIEAFRKWVGLTEGKVVKKEAYPIAFDGTRLSRGNIVLTGDAAGLTNPLTKGGLAAIIHTAKILGEAVNHASAEGSTTNSGEAVARAYAQRVRAHPVADPIYQEALEIILSWENEDFEQLTRFAPKDVTSGGPMLKRAALLGWGMLTNLDKASDVFKLYRAMALSKGYSW